MLEWACDAAESSEKDLLELYCGNGNFTLPLLKFKRVLATELAKSSVYAAQWNIEQNQIDNIPSSTFISWRVYSGVSRWKSV